MILNFHVAFHYSRFIYVFIFFSPLFLLFMYLDATFVVWMLSIDDGVIVFHSLHLAMCVR